MGFKKNNPGCNCCGDCVLCSDSFDRAGSSDINTGSDCGWSEVSGSWDISSNNLRCTSAGVAICTTQHPDFDYTLSTSVRVSHDTSSSSCDIFVGLDDESNNFFARLTFAGASGTVKLYSRSAGVDTLLVTSAALDLYSGGTVYDVTVCVSEAGTFSVTVDGIAIVSAEASGIYGYQVGLGASGSGTATFNNFSLSKSYHSTTAENCGRCIVPCSHCTDDVPSSYQIVISGATSISGTYIVDYWKEASPGVCYWRCPAGVCGYTWIYLDMDSVQIRVYFDGVNCNYSLSVTSPVDCLSSRVITNVTSACPCGAGSVDQTGTSATVTAL